MRLLEATILSVCISLFTLSAARSFKALDLDTEIEKSEEQEVLLWLEV